MSLPACLPACQAKEAAMMDRWLRALQSAMAQEGKPAAVTSLPLACNASAKVRTDVAIAATAATAAAGTDVETRRASRPKAHTPPR